MSQNYTTPPSAEEIEAGASLPGLGDERFCLLIIRGSTPLEAHKIAYPHLKLHTNSLARERTERPHINARIQFLRQEIAMRTTISLAHKRDLLAKMALGEIPTEVIDLPSGKKIRKYQHLSAIKYDAKLSGEEAAKKIDVMGTGLKLSFVLPSRDGQEPIAIQPTPQQPALPSSIFDPQDTIDVTPEEPYEPTISYGHGADTGDTPKEFTWDTPKEFTGDTPKEFTGDTPKEPTGESSGIPRTPSSTSSDGAALEQSIEDNIIFSATGISGRRQQDDDEPEDHVE